MTRRPTLVATLVLLLLIVGSFIAEAALKHEACTAAQITDFTNPTIYPEVCQ